MDLQYIRVMTDELKASEEVVAFIAEPREIAEVNVFQRFARMRLGRRQYPDQCPETVPTIIFTLASGRPVAWPSHGSDAYRAGREGAAYCISERLRRPIAKICRTWAS